MSDTDDELSEDDGDGYLADDEVRYTKVKLHATMRDQFTLKSGVSFEGSVPKDPKRTTDIAKISWADKRILQLLRHLATHVLDFANRNGLGAVEIQAAWVAGVGRVFVTANVGAAVNAFADGKVDNVSFFFKKVAEHRKGGDGDMAIEDRPVERHNRKLQGVKVKKRTFAEDGFADIAQAMLLVGQIEFVPAGKAQAGKAPIVFLTHGHSKDGGNVRHAEQIIIEHLRALKIDGPVHISGTKIPCFTCYAEHQWSQQYIKLLYVDMCGALFKNTLNKNIKEPKLLAQVGTNLGSKTVNLISEVMSDSDYGGGFYE